MSFKRNLGVLALACIAASPCLAVVNAACPATIKMFDILEIVKNGSSIINNNSFVALDAEQLKKAIPTWQRIPGIRDQGMILSLGNSGPEMNRSVKSVTPTGREICVYQNDDKTKTYTIVNQTRNSY